MNRDLPNLKRLWYCDHVHTKTGGCVCKKHGKPICASIENVSIPDIDQIRLKERLSRLPRARSVWDKMRHAADSIEGISALQFFAQLQAVSRMMCPSPMVEVDYSSLEKRILSKEEAYRHFYGARPEMMIIDEAHLWPAAYARSGKLERRELMFHREPAEPRPTEGAPKVQKPWHKFIEPNNRKKPR